MEARTMQVAMRLRVPSTLTRKTHSAVAKALPRPVFVMRKEMNRSNVGARATATPRRGTLGGHVGGMMRLMCHEKQAVCRCGVCTIIIVLKPHPTSLEGTLNAISIRVQILNKA